MNFETMNQAIEFVRKLQEIYSHVHILDTNDKKILYNLSYPSSNGSVSLSVTEEAGAVMFATIVPITIESRSCYLELVQYASKQNGTQCPAQEEERYAELHLMQEQLVIDPLTKLYNRRFIDERLPLDMVCSFETDEPLTVIYADVDYFKRLNDEYGHVTGDYVLHTIADLMRRQVRITDSWIARYGGEEFLICLPGINRKTAIKITQRIRRVIENHPLQIGNHILHVTCSFGVQTVYKNSSIKTVNEIVALVDKKLYNAKRNGRNRVEG